MNTEQALRIRPCVACGGEGKVPYAALVAIEAHNQRRRWKGGIYKPMPNNTCCPVCKGSGIVDRTTLQALSGG